MANASANVTWRCEQGANGNCNSNWKRVHFYPKNYWNGERNSQKYRLGKIRTIKIFRKVIKDCGYYIF